MPDSLEVASTVSSSPDRDAGSRDGWKRRVSLERTSLTSPKRKIRSAEAVSGRTFLQAAMIDLGLKHLPVEVEP
jgi:hypothetical protein